MQNAFSIDGRIAEQPTLFSFLIARQVSMRKTSQIGRRKFLGQTAATIVAPLMPLGRHAGTLWLSATESERARHGRLDRVGGQGFDNLRQLLRLPDVQVVAVCDVEPLHYRDNPWNEGAAYGREPALAHVERHYAEQKNRAHTRAARC